MYEFLPKPAKNSLKPRFTMSRRKPVWESASAMKWGTLLVGLWTILTYGENGPGFDPVACWARHLA